MIVGVQKASTVTGILRLTDENSRNPTILYLAFVFVHEEDDLISSSFYFDFRTPEAEKTNLGDVVGVHVFTGWKFWGLLATSLSVLLALQQELLPGCCHTAHSCETGASGGTAAISCYAVGVFVRDGDARPVLDVHHTLHCNHFKELTERSQNTIHQVLLSSFDRTFCKSTHDDPNAKKLRNVFYSMYLVLELRVLNREPICVIIKSNLRKILRRIIL